MLTSTFWSGWCNHWQWLSSIIWFIVIVRCARRMLCQVIGFVKCFIDFTWVSMYWRRWNCGKKRQKKRNTFGKWALGENRSERVARIVMDIIDGQQEHWMQTTYHLSYVTRLYWIPNRWENLHRQCWYVVVFVVAVVAVVAAASGTAYCRLPLFSLFISINFCLRLHLLCLYYFFFVGVCQISRSLERTLTQKRAHQFLWHIRNQVGRLLCKWKIKKKRKIRLNYSQ